MKRPRQKRPNRNQSSKTYGKGPVRYRLPEDEAGPIQISVDYGLAVVPDQYYYADSFSLQRDDKLGIAVLVFGRSASSEPGARDRLEIAMPESSLFDTFWRSSRSVEQSLDQQLASMKKKGIARPAPAEVARRATLYANNIFIATGGTETCLDFYYLSPRDVHLAKTRKAQIELFPIIRVIISPVLVKYMFNELRPHAEGASVAGATQGRSQHAGVS